MGNAGFIQFNNSNSYYDMGMKILDKVIIPYPKKKMEITSIPGSEGDLYIDTDGYEDIILPISFEVIDKIQIENKYRKIKRWLNSIEDDHLFLFDDMDYFYKVKFVEIPNNFETMFNLYGVADIKFICDPYTYSKRGEEEIELPPSLYNDTGYKSKPIYRITGEGLITLNVNSKLITFNVGQELIIDTDLELIFRAGNIENSRKTGKWEDLYLMPGQNTLSYSGGRVDKITIQPNWRMI